MTTAATFLPPDYTPHTRAERLIAVGRLVLASASLIAIYLEPSTPARYQRGTYGLLLVYTAYALAMVLVAWRSPVPPSRWRLFSHALDLVLFSVIIYLTEGPASPFFLYFVFSLFCATLRFSWRGILATGLTAMAIYAAMAIGASRGDPEFESSRVLIREAYLAVIAALLVYLGIYHQRLRSELASLAAWPRELASEIEDVLRVTLAHAASVVKTPRAILLWEEREEPWLYTATFDHDRFTFERLPPDAIEATPDSLRNTCLFIRASEPPLLYDPAHSAASEVTATPLGPKLLARYELESAIVVSLESETLGLRLIVPDVRTATADELALAHIAARLLLATLEQFFFVQQVRQTASADERLRISRDLHDGIVQSLGGVGLQLQAIRNEATANPAVDERLGHLQRVIEHDQRELRAIVRELRPHDRRDGRTIIEDELQRMRERFALEWALELAAENGLNVDVPPSVAHELCRIVNESLSNAARHGGATRADISMSHDRDRIHLRISDNGKGFPFTGRYDLGALQRWGYGPRTLKERIASLHGSLTIESSRSGAVLDAFIPLPEGSRK